MQKVGRNEPCPCGSGKKYKNCHLKAENGTGESEAKSEQRLPKAKTFREMIQNYNCNQILKIIAVL